MSWGTLLQSVGTIIFWHNIQAVVTSVVLRCAYSFPVEAMRLKTAAPSSLAAGSHRAAAYMVTAIGLFAYRVISELYELPTSMYSVLRVSPTAHESDIRKSYRHLARAYHPDKVGFEHEDVFVRIHEAYSTLVDPVTRFAYDRCALANRFGHQAIGWRHASTIHDYMANGMELFVYAQLYIVGIHALNWLVSRGDRRYNYTLGTYVR